MSIARDMGFVGEDEYVGKVLDSLGREEVRLLLQRSDSDRVLAITTDVWMRAERWRDAEGASYV